MRHYWIDPFAREGTVSDDDFPETNAGGPVTCPGKMWTLWSNGPDADYTSNPIWVWGNPEEPPMRQSQRTDGQGQTERHSRMVQAEGGPSSTRAFGAGNNAYR